MNQSSKKVKISPHELSKITCKYVILEILSYINIIVYVKWEIKFERVHEKIELYVPNEYIDFVALDIPCLKQKCTMIQMKDCYMKVLKTDKPEWMFKTLTCVMYQGDCCQWGIPTSCILFMGHVLDKINRYAHILKFVLHLHQDERVEINQSLIQEKIMDKFPSKFEEFVNSYFIITNIEEMTVYNLCMIKKSSQK